MAQEPFLTPRFVGSRFADSAIPLEMLRDFAVLEEFIVELAKAEFRKQNPGRQRVPRGFAEKVSLKLSAVHEGSAVAVISLVDESGALFPAELGYFHQARDAMLGAVGAAGRSEDASAHVPAHLLTYFDRFGRGLRDGESIELTAGESGPSATYTPAIRRRLRDASPALTEYTEESKVRGLVPEMDQEKMTFHLQLADGTRVGSGLDSRHFDVIFDAFGHYRAEVPVLVEGVARYGRDGRLRAFESIEHVSILDRLDVHLRLEVLRGLADGWLDSNGCTPSAEGIDWLLDRFGKDYPEELPLPYTYPTEDGNIRFEWGPVGDFEASLDVDLQLRQGYWHELERSTDEDRSRELSLDDPASWEWLAKRVQAGSVAPQ